MFYFEYHTEQQYQWSEVTRLEFVTEGHDLLTIIDLTGSDDMIPETPSPRNKTVIVTSRQGMISSLIC